MIQEQDKLPLGHEFVGSGSYCEELLGYDTELGDDYCRQPRAVHEPDLYEQG